MTTTTLGYLPAVIVKLVATTVIGATGGLTVAPVAQAYPPQGSECTQFGFKGPMPFQANGNPRSGDDSSWRLTFDSIGTTASGPAKVFFFNSGETITGHVVSGGIVGRNITFSVQFDDKPYNFWDFSGTIDDHGSARGTETVAGGNLPARWDSGFALDCLAPVAPQQPPPPSSHGPNTCAQGFVWREASQYDETCVSPETRDQAARQNSLANQNRDPNGGPYGKDTCNQGFVWRDAFAGDHVCVTGADRDQAAADNAAAPGHLAAT